MGKAANASPKERKSMSASIFCGPGRTFPIEDQGDVDSAAKLIGKAKNKASVIACIKGKAKAHGWSYPASWDESAKMAGFALPSGWTYAQLQGFLQSELSEDKPPLPADSDAADDQGEIDGTSYYYPMIRDFDDTMIVFTDDWDDDLFQCTYKITQSDAGKDVKWGAVIEVYGQMVYKPVAEMAAGPRRAEFAAFAEGEIVSTAHTSEGDWVTRRGVVMEAANYEDKGITIAPEHLYIMADSFVPVSNRVNHVTGEDRTPSYFDGNLGTLDALELAEDGATLIGTVTIPRWFDDYHRAHFPGEPLKNSLEIDLDDYHVSSNTLVPNPRVNSSALMSAHAAFAKLGDQSQEPQEDRQMGKTGTTEKAEGTAQTVSFADFAALKAQNEAQASQIAAMAATTREANAVAFAKRQATAGKIVPAMVDHWKAQYLIAATDDDGLANTVNFSVRNAETKATEVKSGTRVQALEAMFAEMPVLPMLQEFVDGDHAIVFSERPEAASSRKADSDAAIEEARKKAEQQRDRQKR